MDSQCRGRAHGRDRYAAKKVIQAAVTAARGGNEEPPPELRLYWQCRRFNALPDAGAVLDQDAGLLSRMTILGNVYETIQRVSGMTGEAIHDIRPDDGRILAWLDELGVQVGITANG